MQKNAKNNETPKIETFLFGEESIRVVIDGNNEPWFVAVDICKILDLDTSYAIKSRKSRDFKDGISAKYMDNVHVPHPQSANKSLEVLAVKEADLYQLIFKSRKEEAKIFQEWIFEEVLPTIRKKNHKKFAYSKNITNLAPTFNL
jgi:prophage antirepressor-like protein